jgi:hypothetical protein
MVAATAPDAQAERGDLGRPDGIVAAVDIHAGRAVEAPRGGAMFGQQVDHRLLQAADQLAYLEAAPGEVEQRIDDDLAGPW